MKKVIFITLSLLMLSCSQQQVKSEREKSIDNTKTMNKSTALAMNLVNLAVLNGDFSKYLRIIL